MDATGRRCAFCGAAISGAWTRSCEQDYCGEWCLGRALYVRKESEATALRTQLAARDDELARLREYERATRDTVCWGVACVHEAKALDMLARGEQELARLRAIEKAAREYLAAIDAEDEADDTQRGALCAAWLVTNAAAANLRALLTQADGGEGVERG